MNVTFTCKQCDQPNRAEATPDITAITCAKCGLVTAVTADAFEEGKLCACLICGCRELFSRKNFSQRLGVAIVVFGFVLSTIAWGFHFRFLSYAILFATALVDVVMYLAVDNLLQCYRCHAEYRRLDESGQHAPFDLATHERFRQQAMRLASAKKV
jgi:hypothetical protein